MGKTAAKSYTLDELFILVNDKSKKFKVILDKSSKWIDWESSVFLTGEAQIMEVKPKAEWPLMVSFSGSMIDTQPVPYDPKMEFYCKT
ncbi:MAG: hypothetical protein IT291_06490 [Deltaproteobacteria bacterium]|nr:hypothetical protein [Deltaproteobacteria bacterium]